VEIVREGDDGRKLCFIASGQVEVVLTADGRDRRIALLNDGDFFGEMALLSGDARTATVRTTMPTELYSLSRADFLTLLDRDPVLRRAVEETIAGRRRALAEATHARQETPSGAS
jgi:CRP-like cAMP-binding protein